MSANPPNSNIPTYEVNVATLPRTGFTVALRPDEAERGRVAIACDVEAFDLLEADLTLKRWRGDGVELSGEIRATVRQACVVTLEPVTSEIREAVAMTFLPEGSKLALDDDESKELIIDPDGPDIPDSFSGDTLDLWPITVECLILAIDPFPRAPDAEIDSRHAGEDAGEGSQSPFAVLKDVKIDAK